MLVLEKVGVTFSHHALAKPFARWALGPAKLPELHYHLPRLLKLALIFRDQSRCIATRPLDVGLLLSRYRIETVRLDHHR